MNENKKGIIDRFEGDYGIVTINDETEGFPINLFPLESKPGDVVEIDGTMITVVEDETEKLRFEMADLMGDVL
ncbi:DUF3006 domain-containing protein [Peribacillus cavernae]|uniref:DUF3006 domain-containing protein n=1 Tax=Peribacillus cavernae TaxID=1674310 RepID=A0A433HCA4_9BACI|nr:DUF3006 domain-containing protein [Peribacillus cavernae]MDQ0219600.1 hypothetical protein [Peribacillus cavernae]RUQ25888.1 DUF3006 domain-containing protein [Peribacillus cavernae]